LADSELPRWGTFFDTCGLRELTLSFYTNAVTATPLVLSVPSSISALTSLTSLTLGVTVSRAVAQEYPEMVNRINLPSGVSLPALRSLALTANLVKIPSGFCSANCTVIMSDKQRHELIVEGGGGAGPGAGAALG
jgi:hypothetical protein